MRCPYCNNEMVRGFLCGSGGKINFIMDYSSGDKMGDNINLKNNKDYVKGYQCEDCKKIIFDCNSREGYNEPY